MLRNVALISQFADCRYLKFNTVIVNVVETATIRVNVEKNTPKSGTASDVGGVISLTIVRKKQTDRRIVVWNPIFSDISCGGSENASRVITEITSDGMIKLKP